MINRIAICEHTQCEVIQFFNAGEWICLHNETPALDLAEIIDFKANDLNLTSAWPHNPGANFLECIT